jgi:hypothetical protein
MSIMYKLIKTGVWGLGSSEKLEVGKKVIVTKKDGSQKTETVGCDCL